MAKPDTRRWEALRRQVPLSVARALAYQRLMQADGLLAELRGGGPGRMTLADFVEPGELEQEDDLYLTTLAKYVASLGGHIEVQAVFPETAITVLGLPDQTDDSALP
jgi:hypothetical protein